MKKERRQQIESLLENWFYNSSQEDTSRPYIDYSKQFADIIRELLQENDRLREDRDRAIEAADEYRNHL